MTPLADDENKYYEKQKECYICQKEFCNNKKERMKFKLYKKVRDHCRVRGAAHSIWKGDFTLGGISALRQTISKRHRSDLGHKV